MPVRWPSVDRRRHELSDDHLSVRPAESSVVVSVRPVSFWLFPLSGCLAILSATHLGHILGRASQPSFFGHHLVVLSATFWPYSQPSVSTACLRRTVGHSRPYSGPRVSTVFSAAHLDRAFGCTSRLCSLSRVLAVVCRPSLGRTLGLAGYMTA